jgi:hypothetical protein
MIRMVGSLEALAGLVAQQPGLYVRYSVGPEEDTVSASVD